MATQPATHDITLHAIQYNPEETPIRRLISARDNYGYALRANHTTLTAMLNAHGLQNTLDNLRELAKQADLISAAAGDGKTACILSKEFGFRTCITTDHRYYGAALQTHDILNPPDTELVPAAIQEAMDHTKMKKWLQDTDKPVNIFFANMLTLSRQGHDPQNTLGKIGRAGAWKTIIDKMLNWPTQYGASKERAAIYFNATTTSENTPFTPAELALYIETNHPTHTVVAYHEGSLDPTTIGAQDNLVYAIIPKTRYEKIKHQASEIHCPDTKIL